ncbi:MAG: hypothetical protein HOU81_12025 [Hamadaea sp.]|uniref:hypothetical protein n=1 Tax=Hamadaea sp. TaxID=2024425 RepID=UPI0017C1BF1F|nr:hypothetical protein [Hamadaea sp.]NUR71538.1 hypothetical protein [Hamadaea sp.]NUT19662.1 hypothetical protein [Hamadaea sp.]
MKLTIEAVFAGLVWVAVVTGALMVLAMHVRDVRRGLRTANHQALLQSRTPYHEMVMRYPVIHRVLFEGEDFDRLDDDSRVRVTQAWSLLMTWHESVLLHEQSGAIAKATADQWTTMLRGQLRTPAFQRLWVEHGWTFHPALKLFVSVAAGLPAPKSPDAVRAQVG